MLNQFLKNIISICLLIVLLWARMLHHYVNLLLVGRELSHRAYRLDSADDLTKPFVSMYFGAAYFVWLSEYEGRLVSSMMKISTQVWKHFSSKYCI